MSINYNSTIRVTEITVPYNLDENMVAVGREFAPAVFARYASTTSNNTVTVTLANHGFVTDDQVEVALPTSNISSFAIETVQDVQDFIAENPTAIAGSTTGKFLITKVDDNTFTLVTPTNMGTASNVICTTRESGYFFDFYGNKEDLLPGQVLSAFNLVGGSHIVNILGDVRKAKFIIGEPYEMHYRFAKQRLTESPTQGSELISGRLQLKHFYLKFEDTGFMQVEVTPDNNTTSKYEFTSTLGTETSTIGRVNLETGTFKVPVLSRADRVTIDIKNATHLPSNITSAEYEATFYMRSNRR